MKSRWMSSSVGLSLRSFAIVRNPSTDVSMFVMMSSTDFAPFGPSTLETPDAPLVISMVEPSARSLESFPSPVFMISRSLVPPSNELCLTISTDSFSWSLRFRVILTRMRSSSNSTRSTFPTTSPP